MTQFVEIGEDVVFCSNAAIHSQIRIKAKYLNEQYRDRYFCVGFYAAKEDVEKSNQIVLKSDAQMDAFIRQFEQIFKLEENSVLYGNWVGADMSKTFLLPTNQAPTSQIAQNELKNLYSNISFSDDQIAIAGISWAFYTYFLAYFCKQNPSQSETLIVTYHTILSGLGQLLYRNKGPMFQYVSFTAQAFDANLCRFVYVLHDLSEAKDQNSINIQCQLVQTANLFTSTSQSLKEHCKVLFDKEPGYYVQPGVDTAIEKDESDDTQLNYTHKYTKQQIQKFLKVYFYGKLDLKNTLTFMIHGASLKEDGIWVFLQALAQLNMAMKDQDFVSRNPNLYNKQIVCFIVYPRKCKQIQPQVLQKMLLMKEAEDRLNAIKKEIHTSLNKKICSLQGVKFTQLKMKDLCSQKELSILKNIQQQLKELKGVQPVCTHILEEQEDELLLLLQELKLTNNDDDFAKIIWIPQEITENSILQMSYNEFIRGINLAILPSVSDAQNPLSFVCRGTATIISNVSSFGRYISSKISDDQNKQKEVDFIDRQNSLLMSNMSFSNLALLQSNLTKEQWNKLKSQKWETSRFGIEVINRDQNSDEIEELKNLLIDFLRLSQYERIQLRNTMTRNCIEFDWSEMIQEYFRAYDMAMM